MSSTRPDVDNALLMEAQLTDSSATLTFVNADLNKKDERSSNNNYAQQNASVKSLINIQKETHRGIPDANFVRSFSDDKNQAVIKSMSQTGFDSAFGSMAHYAFSQHKTIVLRPDDIHLLVVQGIARFLQQYPEDFRKTVVSFQGKQTVKINMEGIDDIDDWNQMPLGFAGMIRQLINSPAVADVLLQDYSQSTDMDRRVKAVTLMGTFSAYFNYVAATMCRIPQFILEGTVGDWLSVSSIPEKIISLLNLSASNQENGLSLLHRWLERLQPILNEMHLARTGVMNGEFWNNFYKFESESGGDHVSGNIVYFYPFLKSPGLGSNPAGIYLNDWIMGKDILLGKYGPGTDQLTTNFTEVDFVLEHSVNGKTEFFEMGMKAGIVACKEKIDYKLHTHVDCSIFFKKKTPADFQLKSVSRDSQIDQHKSNSTSSNQYTGIIATQETTAPAQTAIHSNLFTTKPKKKITFELVLDEDRSAIPALR